MTRGLRLEERLAAAAEIGDAAEVKRLIADGADVNWRDDEGATALIVACRNRAIGCIPLLLDANADPNIADGDQPLNDCCRNNDLPTALLLLQKGANPNGAGVGERPLRPIEIAACKGNHHLFDALLDAGATLPSPRFMENILRSISVKPAEEIAGMYIKLVKLLKIDLPLARQAALDSGTSIGHIAASMLEAELLEEHASRYLTNRASVHTNI